MTDVQQLVKIEQTAQEMLYSRQLWILSALPDSNTAFWSAHVINSFVDTNAKIIYSAIAFLLPVSYNET